MCMENENIAEPVMATKDQEREALQQIKDLVDSLGPNSYIATAFKGVFDVAEENIDNDFSGNPVDHAYDLGVQLAQRITEEAKKRRSDGHEDDVTALVLVVQ